MNIQEAYNKGLNDAEDRVMLYLTRFIEDRISEKFENPQLQSIWNVIQNELSDSFTETETISSPAIEEGTNNDYSLVRDIINVLVGNDTPTSSTNEDTNKILEIIKIRSDHYRELAGGNTRIGKKFKQNVDSQLQTLNSML